MGIKNEFTKYDLYEIISSRGELAQYLPPARLFNDFYDVIKFIELYERIIIKPLYCASKKTTCIIEKLEKNFKITDCRKTKPIKIFLSTIEELIDFLKDSEDDFKKCIIQKYIKLAKFEKSTSDVRVVMKKITNDKWSLSGIECMFGGNEFLFTNLSNESFSFQLNETMKKFYPLHFDFSKKIEEVYEVCLKACNIIDRFLDYTDDIGFDIAIDEEDKIWIIEVNIFERLKKFFVIDYNTYLPLKYASLLYIVSSYNYQNK